MTSTHLLVMRRRLVLVGPCGLLLNLFITTQRLLFLLRIGAESRLSTLGATLHPVQRSRLYLPNLPTYWFPFRELISMFPTLEVGTPGKPIPQHILHSVGQLATSPRKTLLKHLAIVSKLVLGRRSLTEIFTVGTLPRVVLLVVLSAFEQ